MMTWYDGVYDVPSVHFRTSLPFWGVLLQVFLFDSNSFLHFGTLFMVLGALKYPFGHIFLPLSPHMVHMHINLTAIFQTYLSYRTCCMHWNIQNIACVIQNNMVLGVFMGEGSEFLKLWVLMDHYSLFSCWSTCIIFLLPNLHRHQRAPVPWLLSKRVCGEVEHLKGEWEGQACRPPAPKFAFSISTMCMCLQGELLLGCFHIWLFSIDLCLIYYWLLWCSDVESYLLYKKLLSSCKFIVGIIFTILSFVLLSGTKNRPLPNAY